MRNPLIGLLVALFTAIVVAGCGGSDSPDSPASTPETATTPASESPATPSEVPDVDPAAQGPVAIVNGEEITRADFDQEIQQVEASYEQQGVPFPAGEELIQLQQEVVTRLVQQELVLQESVTRGITASDEEVEAEYQAAASSFPDEETFNQAIEAQGLSLDEVRGLIADNIRITKLLDSVLQQAQIAPPTEEELRAVYEQVAQQQELPPFEELREQIESEVQNQREDEVLRAFVQELEAAGTIEILLS